MVNFKKLSDRAKDLVEKRGGPDGLKQDAAQLREIAKGQGSMADKAKAAAAALKETGAEDPGQTATADAPSSTTTPKPDPAAPSPVGEELDAEQVKRKAERRKDRSERKAGGGDPAL